MGTRRETPALVSAAGVSAVLAGLTAWVWLGDWRWAVTGLCVGLMVLLLGSAVVQVGGGRRERL